MLLPGVLCAIAIVGLLAWHNGYRLYIVETGSMAPAILSGDAVLDGPPRRTYHPGEIITFRHSAQTADLVTHRITDVGRGLIQTKGDANRTADSFGIRPDQVQGVYVMKFPQLGYLLIFLKRPAGIASLVLIVFALLLLGRLLSRAEKAPQSAATNK